MKTPLLGTASRASPTPHTQTPLPDPPTHPSALQQTPHAHPPTQPAASIEGNTRPRPVFSSSGAFPARGGAAACVCTTSRAAAKAVGSAGRQYFFFPLRGSGPRTTKERGNQHRDRGASEVPKPPQQGPAVPGRWCAQTPLPDPPTHPAASQQTPFSYPPTHLKRPIPGFT